MQSFIDSTNHELNSHVSATQLDAAELYAAVDLGSNSFHLVISRYQHGRFTVIDKQREVVRLAAGLDENNLLCDEVSDRALYCLEKFGQLLRKLPKQNVRVVGTNVLRRLHQKSVFLERAEKAIGQNIEIIAGREEARLIYLGVSKWSGKSNESRLVMDIGGGSTEIIVGQGSRPLSRESLELGCVVQSQKFFADGVLTKEKFEQAILVSELLIRPLVKQFRSFGWEHVIGCSGTMKALSNAYNTSGVPCDSINMNVLQRLLDMAIQAGHIDALELPNLSADRKPVFAGGLSILLALFYAFDIRDMSISEIALREGVLYDLVGRRFSEDIRDITINAMEKRWVVDSDFADKVANTAHFLYQCVADSWDIKEDLFQQSILWSAKLHEIGLSISHDKYQKHGAYMVANADMAGFTRRDQLLLSALILGHRGKFPIAEIEALPSSLVTPTKRLVVILRLAVLFHRGRHFDDNKITDVTLDGQCITLICEKGFLEKNSLTRADLKQEQSRLKSVGVKLDFI